MYIYIFYFIKLIIYNIYNFINNEIYFYAILITNILICFNKVKRFYDTTSRKIIFIERDRDRYEIKITLTIIFLLNIIATFIFTTYIKFIRIKSVK